MSKLYVKEVKGKVEVTCGVIHNRETGEIKTYGENAEAWLEEMEKLFGPLDGKEEEPDE